MFKMSTRVRYGLRAAVALALNGAWRGGPAESVPLSMIVKSQKMSEPYLRQIFFLLKKANVVEAAMGKNGGYRLARTPERVTAYDVVRGLGEDIDPVKCVRRPNTCSLRETCPTRPLWCELDNVVRKMLTVTTVRILAERCPGRGRKPSLLGL